MRQRAQLFEKLDEAYMVLWFEPFPPPGDSQHIDPVADDWFCLT